MDPLSDVLALLKLDSYGSRGLDAGAHWSLAWAASEGIHFFTLASGSCWLELCGEEPRRVEPGDGFVLPRGSGFRLASDLALPSLDAHRAFVDVPPGGVLTCGGGGDAFGVGGYFDLAGDDARLLLDALPPLVHVRDDGGGDFRWYVERMCRELTNPSPGSAFVVQQLALMVLVTALRHPRNEGRDLGANWLRGLCDPRIAAAIGAIHAAPGHHWTLVQLAASADMSRTVFAETFKRLVGVAPMEYLARWRMMVAADRLTRSRDSVAELALALGYESESAFSTAFRRIKGVSPRFYRRPHIAS